MNRDKPALMSWLNPKCHVRDTGKYGKGVYANEPIQCGEIVCVGGGYVLTIQDESWFSGQMADKPVEIAEEFYIGPRTDEDISSTIQVYINHSCNPNVGLMGQIIYIAMKDIQALDEICIDYALFLYATPSSNLVFTFQCLCGYKDCRKIITENDWMIPALQKKYRGYFSSYLQAIIDKSSTSNMVIET